MPADRFLTPPCDPAQAPGASSVPGAAGAPEPQNKPSPTSFEAALAELEALVQSMERPGLPLEDLLQGYQRGVALGQFCQDKLSHVQGEVERLSAAQEAGALAPGQRAGEAP